MQRGSGSGSGGGGQTTVVLPPPPSDPWEAFSPLQVNELGDQDGILAIVGAEPFGPDTRPNALLPFAAPTGSAATVSADVTSSAATSRNFESGGQAWLEIDTTGLQRGRLQRDHELDVPRRPDDAH